MVRGKVLVVDDDRKTVDSIRLYLEHAGYDVRTAYTDRRRSRSCVSRRPISSCSI